MDLEILRKELNPAWWGNGAIFRPPQECGLLIHLCLNESQIFKIKLSLHICVYIFFISLIGFRTFAETLQGQAKSKDFSWPVKMMKWFLRWLRWFSLKIILRWLLENSSFKTSYWIDLADCMRKILHGNSFDCAITFKKVKSLEEYKWKVKVSVLPLPVLCSRKQPLMIVSWVSF